MGAPSTALDVMRAIAACGLRRGDVDEVLVERDRDRHFTVEVETTVRDGLMEEIREKIAGAGLNVKQMRIKRMAGSVRFDVRLRESFSPWPLTEVNDIFVRTLRANPITRVEANAPNPEGADPFRLLDNLELARLNPGMYLGTTASAVPLFERVFEPFMLRAARGESTAVEITLKAKGQLTLADDAPGAQLLGPEGEDLEVNRLDGGGVVKALSASYREESKRGERVQLLEYANGRRALRPPVARLERDGNVVSLTPDFDLIDASFDVERVRGIIEWNAMVAPRARVRFNGAELRFDSLQPAVRRLAEGPVWSNQVFEFSFDDPLVHLDCALAWRDGTREVHWHVNRQRVGGDGSLEHGLRAALRNAISLGRPELEVEDPLAHVVGLVMAQVPDSRAGSRGQYEDPAVDAVVERELTAALSVFLDSLEGGRERLMSPEPAAPAEDEQGEREQARGAKRAAAGRGRRSGV
ncbi:MAG: hypothetical protein QM723_21360 [Myxococcaceae bacterium]